MRGLRITLLVLTAISVLCISIYFLVSSVSHGQYASRNSIKAFQEGRVEDVKKDDIIWIPKTYQMYTNGARAIVGALMKYYKKEIH